MVTIDLYLEIQIICTALQLHYSSSVVVVSSRQTMWPQGHHLHSPPYEYMFWLWIILSTCANGRNQTSPRPGNRGYRVAGVIVCRQAPFMSASWLFQSTASIYSYTFSPVYIFNTSMQHFCTWLNTVLQFLSKMYLYVYTVQVALYPVSILLLHRRKETPCETVRVWG